MFLGFNCSVSLDDRTGLLLLLRDLEGDFSLPLFMVSLIDFWKYSSEVLRSKILVPFSIWRIPICALARTWCSRS